MWLTFKHRLHNLITLPAGGLLVSLICPQFQLFSRFQASVHIIVDTSYDQDITLQNSFELLDAFEDASDGEALVEGIVKDVGFTNMALEHNDSHFSPTTLTPSHCA